MALAGKFEDDETDLSCSTNVDDNREHESLSNCQDTNSTRESVAEDPKTIVEENPLLNGRLHSATKSHLNWQHLPCKHHIPEPVMQTLSADHVCKPCSNPSNLAKSYDHSSPSSVIDSSLFPTANESSGTFVKVFVDTNKISEEKSCPDLSENEVPTLAPESGLPQKVVLTLNNGSPPTSMDFHPTWHYILLVGTEIGSISIWDVAVASDKELLSINFEKAHSAKAAIEKELRISVNKVIWSSDGSKFGVAFSKHLVHLYSSFCDGERRIGISRHSDIEAHDGSVNDIAFCFVENRLLLITCGEDKTVKVWDAAQTVRRINTLRAHNAPVCSICTHVKENSLVIFSASTDGKINEWVYYPPGKGADYDALSCGYKKLAYSTDDRRLFSCGVIKKGEPFLAEWDDSQWEVKRVYKGLKVPCSPKIQFDTTLNRFLAAGDDYMVKYWEMDSVQLLASTKAGGELLAYPCLCFNKEGSLLAVAAEKNKIKIVAHDYDDFWNTVKIFEPSQFQILQLPAHQRVNQIVRLIYNNAGEAILALASDGVNILLWKWLGNVQATSHDSPHLSQPENGLQFMSNDPENFKHGESIVCFAVSKNDSYLISASDSFISLFNMKTFETMKTSGSPRSEPTSISFYPLDDNVIAVGFDDSSICICNVDTVKVLKTLRGHSTRVTSLAFSNNLNVLVSAEVNNKIILWNCEEWEILKSRRLAAQGKPEMPCDTHIQFHPQQINFLVVQDRYLAIYEARELALVKQWGPVVPLHISQADFSSDGTEIYAGFANGTIKILDASNLQTLCRIDRNAYLPPLQPSTSGERIYLIAVAANPVKAGQFAVGLSDGSVYMMEPPEAGHKWSTLVHDDNMEAAETSGVEDANSGEEQEFVIQGTIH